MLTASEQEDAMPRDWWIRKRLVFILAFVSLACVITLVAAGLAFPEPFPGAEIGPEWQWYSRSAAGCRRPIAQSLAWQGSRCAGGRRRKFVHDATSDLTFKQLSRHCEGKRSNPFRRTKIEWIASSASLLAMMW